MRTFCFDRLFQFCVPLSYIYFQPFTVLLYNHVVISCKRCSFSANSQIKSPVVSYLSCFCDSIVPREISTLICNKVCSALKFCFLLFFFLKSGNLFDCIASNSVLPVKQNVVQLMRESFATVLISPSFIK